MRWMILLIPVILAAACSNRPGPEERSALKQKKQETLVAEEQVASLEDEVATLEKALSKEKEMTAAYGRELQALKEALRP